MEYGFVSAAPTCLLACGPIPLNLCAASFTHHEFHEDQYAMPHPDDVEPPHENENIRLLLAHYYETEQARLEVAKNTLRAELLPAFVRHRVANIEAAYSGYGDSGCIDGIQFRDTAGVRVDRASIPGGLIDQLESVLYPFLPVGFEINDGSQGTLTIDAQTAKVTIQHQENYSETRDSTREFTL